MVRLCLGSRVRDGSQGSWFLVVFFGFLVVYRWLHCAEFVVSCSIDFNQLLMFSVIDLLCVCVCASDGVNIDLSQRPLSWQAAVIIQGDIYLIYI